MKLRTKTVVIPCLVILHLACQTTIETNMPDAITGNKINDSSSHIVIVKNTESLKSQINSQSLQGLWRSIKDENATFDIQEDSIYYPDHFESYSYKIFKDSLCIYYPGNAYLAKVTLDNDTLVLTDIDNRNLFIKVK